MVFLNISEQTFFEYERIPEPPLRFYMRRKYVHPRIGLNRAGPYDADAHREEDVYIGLVSNIGITSYAKKLLDHLKNGYNHYRGFSATFKVNSVIFNDDLLREISINSLSDALPSIESAYFELAENLPNRSIVVVALDDKIIDKYYTKIKAIRFRYAKKTIHLQLIRSSTLKKTLTNSVTTTFTLFNMATAIYAKIGGIPWLLDQQLIPAGIFIGIAFTKPKVVSFTKSKKEIFYYGILALYNKFGRYIDMSARGITLEIDKRLRGTKGLYIPKKYMIEMLTQIISAYLPPVVIIHKSSRFHKEELEAVRYVLKNKGIDYALIHIESSNPYRGYGEQALDMTAVRGDLILDKEIGNRAILFTTGCTQLDHGVQRRSRPGTPRPLELEIEENVTPYTVKDFAKQVFALTKLDWNTTDLEVRMPITMKYARKVASLTPYITSSITDVRDLM